MFFKRKQEKRIALVETASAICLASTVLPAFPGHRRFSKIETLDDWDCYWQEKFKSLTNVDNDSYNNWRKNIVYKK